MIDYELVSIVVSIYQLINNKTRNQARKTFSVLLLIILIVTCRTGWINRHKRGKEESILSMEGEDNTSHAMQKLVTSCSLFYGSFPRFGVLLLMCILLSVAQIADGGCVQPQEIEACPMIDYKVYGNLDVDAAEEKLEAVVSDRLDQWKSVSVKSKGKKKSKQQKLDFCEDLIRLVFFVA